MAIARAETVFSRQQCTTERAARNGERKRGKLVLSAFPLVARRSLSLSFNRCAIALILCSTAVSSFAGTHVWSGAVSERFSNAGNWYGGSPAGDPNADLSFPSGGRASARNDVNGLSVRSIGFSGTNYSISGNAIGLTAGAEIIDMTAGPNVIACDLVLPSEVAITSAGNILTFSGSISGVGGIRFSGGGRLVFAGNVANSYSGVTRVLGGELQLKKSARATAVAGELRVESTGANYQYGYVSTFADEQIADNAPVTVGAGGELGVGAVETIGPLTLYRGAHVRTSNVLSGSIPITGTLVLNGNINVVGSGSDAYVSGRIVLPATRTLHLTAGYYGLTASGVSAGAPGAGLIISADGDASTGVPHVDVSGTYDGPTSVLGGAVQLTNAHSPVTLSGGTFWGTGASLAASNGSSVRATSYLGGITASGDVRLAAGVDVLLDFRASDRPRIQLNGTLDLSGARLVLGEQMPERQLGNVYTIIENASAQAVMGTFNGLPERSIINDRWRISYKGGNGNDVTLTEAGHLISSISLGTSPSYATEGDPVTIQAQVSTDGGPVVPDGTMAFSSGATVLGTVPLKNGAAALTTTSLPVGDQVVTASYSGSSTIQASKGSTSVRISYRAPTITSVQPATVVGGATTTITVLGSNFVNGSSVLVSSFGYPTTFVSSGELRVEFSPIARNIDVKAAVTVYHPQQNVQLTPFTITITGVTPQRTPLIFGTQSVSAPVTPGAMTAWLARTRRAANFVTSIDARAAVISDDDRDGSVTWQRERAIDPYGIWLAIDLNAGAILAGRVDTTVPIAEPFPKKIFLRDPSGSFSHIVLPYTGTWSMLWARPGVGAWQKLSEDGGRDDLDTATNRTIVFETSSMLAVGSTVAPPSGFAPGDFFLGIDLYGEKWFGKRVDDHLTDAVGPGVISFADAYSKEVREPDGQAHLTVLRREGTDGAVSVQFATADQSPGAGARYKAQSGTLQFGAGEILKTIDVRLIDDTVYSGDDSFQVSLSNPAGATIGTPSAVRITIHDDDPLPVVSFHPSSTSVQEGDSGVVEIPVTVTLQGATSKPVSVTWAWDEGPYSSSAHLGQFVFAPGETSKTFIATYTANTIPEPDRTISLRFGTVIGATMSTGSSIKIVDDDFATISVADASISEGAGSVSVTLMASPASSKPVSITYATSDGSAVAGSDYTATTGTVIFNSDTRKTVSVPILNDANAEGPESFFFTLTGVQNGRLGRSTASISIVDDDVASPRRRAAKP